MIIHDNMIIYMLLSHLQDCLFSCIQIWVLNTFHTPEYHPISQSLSTCILISVVSISVTNIADISATSRYIAMPTHWRYIGNILPRYFPDFFWRFFPIFSRYLSILSRYLPIFSDIFRFSQIYCDFFLFFVFFILPIYCRCLSTFLPINPIISFGPLAIYSSTRYL